MGTEMTAEILAASDTTDTTPSDTPLTKLPLRTSLQPVGDGEALRRVLELAEGLTQADRELRAQGLRATLEMVGASFLTIAIVALSLHRIDEVLDYGLPIPLVGVILFAVFFAWVRLSTLQMLAAERGKNARLAGKAVEFVREYAALTRADRSPVEEAEIQLRLDQLGIEPLDRPM